MVRLLTAWGRTWKPQCVATVFRVDSQESAVLSQRRFVERERKNQESCSALLVSKGGRSPGRYLFSVAVPGAW